MNKIDLIQGRLSILAAMMGTALTIAIGMYIAFPPSLILFYGISVIVVLNIILFVANNVKALRQIRNMKNESEVEKIMTPALTGEPSTLTSKAIVCFRILVAFFLGEIAGSIMLIIIEAIS